MIRTTRMVCPGYPRPVTLTWPTRRRRSCGCRRCSCVPCVRTPRRRGAEPPAARPRGVHPSSRARHLLLVAAGLLGSSATSRTSSVRRWTRSARRSCSSPRCCPVSPTRPAAGGPATGTASSGSGPQGRRLPSRSPRTRSCSRSSSRTCTPRTRTCRCRSTRSRPSTATRLGPAPVLRAGEFVMKDSYSFDIDDEGLQRCLRPAPRGVHPDLRPARPRLRHRLGDVGRHGRPNVSEEFLAPCEFGEDTFVRCRAAYAANVEAVQDPAPSRVPYDDVPAAHVEDTPDTPTIETLVDLLNEQFPRDGPALDRGGHAEERGRDAGAPRRYPRAARDRRPGDREVDMKRLEARWSRPRSRPSTRPTSRSIRSWSRATSARPCWGRRTRVRQIRYLLDPRVVEGTRWVTGANAEGSHVIDLVAGRDFTPDGTIEAAEVRDGDPAPTAGGHRSRPPAASRWATSSSSAASSPKPSI